VTVRHLPAGLVINNGIAESPCINVANVAPFAISLSLILVIHDNMIVTPGFKDKPECKNTCAPGSSYTHASTQ
jgi:hypothetical protein